MISTVDSTIEQVSKFELPAFMWISEQIQCTAWSTSLSSFYTPPMGSVLFVCHIQTPLLQQFWTDWRKAEHWRDLSIGGVMFRSCQKWAWLMGILDLCIFFPWKFAIGRSAKIFSLKNLAPNGLLSCIQIQVFFNINAVQKYQDSILLSIRTSTKESW